MASRRQTTAADLAAAVEIGTMAPSTPVVTAEQAELMARKAAIFAAEQARTTIIAEQAPKALSGTVHECGIAGCRHGDSHPAVSQPDRQVKLQCDTCGMVIRTTSKWIAASGAPKCADGGTFAVAARRTYVRKAA